MRTEEEITNLILDVAGSDDRIKAVLLQGSRSNPNSQRDILQDFDIVYFVRDFNTFLSDKNWINVFGEWLILQFPDDMIFGEKSTDRYAYLMLFKDGNRIDLTLVPVEKAGSYTFDEPTIVLLDKNNLFENKPTPNESGFFVRQPTQKEFSDSCNEFWWVSTYVAKGLWRNEIFYAKTMMDGPVRTMFLQLAEWYIGLENNFSVSVGKNGRYLERWLSPELYQRFLLTYPDSKKENIWTALFLMATIFEELGTIVASRLNFYYNNEEGRNAVAYLQFVHALPAEK